MTRSRTIAVAAVLGVALALAPAAQAGTTIEVGVEDDFFRPFKVTTTVAANELVWIWDLDGSTGGTTEDPHTVSSDDRLFSSELLDTGTYEFSASAGSFAYFCVVHSGMTGKLRVAPTGLVAEAIPRPVGSAGFTRRSITVRWATRDAKTGNRYDVRFKVGKRDWTPWQEDTRRRKAVFGPGGQPQRVKRDRVYRFQARSQKGTGEGKRSGWSPTLKVLT